MILRIRFRQLMSYAYCLALVAPATMTSTAQAQQPTASTAVAAADTEQQLTFEYLFFWKENDARTQGILATTQQEVGKLGSSVSLNKIGIKDPASAKIVEYYGVSRAPMPLVLCRASNGAVTKAFVSPFPAADLSQGVVSRGAAQSLKAIQENKLVVLCALNTGTPASNSVLTNANALQADKRFEKSVQVIALDVSDPNEVSFLAGVKLDAKMSEPTIVILAPPGKQLATLTGAITTEQIAAKLVAAQTTCCPGGQCGPGGQCVPQKK